MKILTDGAGLGIHCIFHTFSYDALFGSGKVFKSDTMNYFENKIFLKGADIQNIYLGGLKIGSIDENGQMIVLNNKLDKENYEQCNAYSEITTKSTNATIDFISQLFNCNYDA